jgi:protein-L-isoaspartate(D-aspartate) O-methyltransferase
MPDFIHMMRQCGSIRLLTLFSFIMGFSSSAQYYDNKDFEYKRQRMVSDQIRARDVKDVGVLEAMRKVPRHLFVPQAVINQAYEDHPLAIGAGQTISQPYIVAYMTEILELENSDKVLEIGTGSGYQTAVLAEVCDSVYSIEIVGPLAEKASKTLKELGYKNIFIKKGDGYQGWEEHAPYSAIIVTCAPSSVPQALQDQLAEGGRMIIPVGEQYIQQLVLLEKHAGKITRKKVLPVRFVPMVNERGKNY